MLYALHTTTTAAGAGAGAGADYYAVACVLIIILCLASAPSPSFVLSSPLLSSPSLELPTKLLSCLELELELELDCVGVVQVVSPAPSQRKQVHFETFRSTYAMLCFQYESIGRRRE